MSRLSNFFRSHNAADTSPTFRKAVESDVEPTLSLLLSNANSLADDNAVREFIEFASERRVDLSQLWLAETRGRVAWTLLPVVSPGRTMLLFSPARPPTAKDAAIAQALVHHVCEQTANVQLAQFLLDPKDVAIRELYRGCGFEELAELLYLHRPITERDRQSVTLPGGFEIATYSDASRTLFEKAILASYEQSLDCPALNGRRSIDDILAGHQAAGEFDPSMWQVVIDESKQPCAALILAPARLGSAVELVYLGLSPSARGRGLSDALMKLAFTETGRVGRDEVSLAVDAKNQPAMKLYYRHGMRKAGSRIAMIREIKR